MNCNNYNGNNITLIVSNVIIHGTRVYILYMKSNTVTLSSISHAKIPISNILHELKNTTLDMFVLI